MYATTYHRHRQHQHPTDLCLQQLPFNTPSFFRTLPLLLPLFSPPVRQTDTRAQASHATSWERPVKEGASGQPTNANPHPCGAGGKGKDGGGGAAAGKSEGGGGGAPPPLPSGWKEVKDPKTGGVYYWNQVRTAHGT